MSDGPQICEWYFDIVSPFAFLQWKQRASFADRVTLKPVPVVLGGLLQSWGIKGPAEVEPKRRQTYRLCQWRASRLGIPFRFPPVHPFNSVNALRLIMAADVTSLSVDLVFDAVFQHGLDVTDMSVIEQLGRSLGLDNIDSRIAGVKDALRENGRLAIQRGVFGVPTTIVGGELFWGSDDTTAMMLDFVADPTLFDRSDMARLTSIRSGLAHPQTIGTGPISA